MVRVFVTLAIVLTILATSSVQKTTAEWKSRTIYQVLTDRFWRTDGSTQGCGNLGNYCGGTFTGLKNQLNYIKNMGFDAIWISPVVKNTAGGYHGYWAMDLYDVNENFGSKQDLKDLISAAQNMGIWVMIDVVANHSGYPQNEGDYTGFNPFNSPSHYHTKCDINPDDWQHNQWRVENCWLANLPDLAQENQYVQQQLTSWITWLQKEYNVDGFRIDTIPEVPKWFWSQFNSAAGVYCVGECFDSRPDYVGGYQGPVNGLLNYPLYFTLNNVWAYGQSSYQIRQLWQNLNSYFSDIDALGVFADNHDNQRFLNRNGNQNMLKNSLAFVFFMRGIPILYYGTEQGFAGGNDPQNRETLWTNFNPNSDLYKWITTLVTYRKKFQVWNLDYTERYVDDNFYAFSRGKVLITTTNQTAGSFSRTLTYLPFAENTKVCNIFYPTQDCLTVSGGKLQVTLLNGETKVYVPQGSL